MAGQNFDSGIYDYESDTSFTSVNDSLSPVKDTRCLTSINTNTPVESDVVINHMVASPASYETLNTRAQLSVTTDHTVVSPAYGNSSSYETLNTPVQPSVAINHTVASPALWNSTSHRTQPMSPMFNLLPSSYVDVPITVQVAMLQVQFLTACSGKCKVQQTKLNELQTFYDLQSSQLESERFQLLRNHRPETLLCNSINHYHDNEHRHLIKMVERSLGLLQGHVGKEERLASHENKSPTSRLPLDGSATQYMTSWFEKNHHNPYPSPAEKWQMSKEVNISVTQVNKWFSNKRIRSGSVNYPASKRRCY